VQGQGALGRVFAWVRASETEPRARNAETRRQRALRHIGYLSNVGPLGSLGAGFKSKVIQVRLPCGTAGRLAWTAARALAPRRAASGAAESASVLSCGGSVKHI
jgi:hypothetical protein